MVKLPAFGKARFLARKLKECDEARGSGDFNAMRDIARSVLDEIPENQQEKFKEQRRRLLVAFAEASHEIGEIGDSIEAFAEALQLADKNFDFVQELASVAEKSGEEIIPVLKSAILTSGQNISLLKPLAKIYQRIGNFSEEADKLYRMVLTRDPEYRAALLGLAHSSVALDKFDRDNLNSLRKAFRLAPKDPVVLRALALTYAKMNPPPEESLGVLRTALREFPDDKRIFNGLTSIYLNIPGYDEERVAHLTEAYRRNPDKAVAEKLLPFFIKNRATHDVAIMVYEVSYQEHELKATLLSYIADAYRAANRRDNKAVAIYEALFFELPHLKDNTAFLAETLADEGVAEGTALLVYERAFTENPSRTGKEVVRLLSREYLATGREDDIARALYQRRLKEDPSDLEVLIALGEMAMEKERLTGDDVKLLRQLFDSKGLQRKMKEDVAERLGEHLAASGAGDRESVALYEFNYENGSASEEEQNLLAIFYAAQKKPELRLRRLFESVYKRTKDEDVLKALINIYVEMKEVEDEAIDLFLAHLKLNPRDKKVLGLVCPYLLKKRDGNTDAYPFIVEALKLDPKLEFVGMKEGEVVNSLIGIGRHFLKSKEFSLGLELFKSAYKRQQSDIIQYLLGVSYLANAEYSTASSVFSDLMKASPENPIYLYRAATLEMARGDMKKAKKGFEQLEAKYPNHPLVHLRAGMLSELENRDDDALSHYSKVKSPNKELNALAKARQGIVLLRAGEMDSAVDSMEAARKELGDDEDLARGLAGAYAVRILDATDSEDITGASAAIKKMLGLTSRDVSFNEMLGTLAFLVNLKLLILGRTDEAMDGVNSMLARDGEHPGSLYLSALIHHFNQRYKPAQDVIDNGLDLGKRLKGYEASVRLLAALNLIRLKQYFDANDHLEWLYAQQKRLEDAFILRIISFYQNEKEQGYPAFLKGQDYIALRDREQFSLGFIGSLFLKGGEYSAGIKFFEKTYKTLQTGQEQLEADYFLGLYHIKSRNEKIGLHHWRNILELKDTGALRSDILNQIYLSLFFHFLDNNLVSEAQQALSKLKPDGGIDIDAIHLFLYLQKGYLEAKAGNLDSAIREWENGLRIFPNNWMLNQNLGLSKVLLGKEEGAVNHLKVLIGELEKGGEKLFGPNYTFMYEESRKIYNHLLSLKAGSAQQVDARRDTILEEITTANRAYWSLNLRKGDGLKEAESHYFRMLKVYNPERYPQEFMQIETAYGHFRKEGHLRMREQLVFNSFDLKRFIAMGSKLVQSETPRFPSVNRFISDFTKPARFFSLKDEFDKAREAVSKLKPELPGPEFTIDDYLVDW